MAEAETKVDKPDFPGSSALLLCYWLFSFERSRQSRMTKRNSYRFVWLMLASWRFPWGLYSQRTRQSSVPSLTGAAPTGRRSPSSRYDMATRQNVSRQRLRHLRRHPACGTGNIPSGGRPGFKTKRAMRCAAGSGPARVDFAFQVGSVQEQVVVNRPRPCCNWIPRSWPGHCQPARSRIFP